MENLNQYGKPCEEKDRVAYTDEKYKYVLEYCGDLFKKGMTLQKRYAARTRFIKVSDTTYAKYIHYLQTGLDAYYNIANRNKS